MQKTEDPIEELVEEEEQAEENYQHVVNVDALLLFGFIIVLFTAAIIYMKYTGALPDNFWHTAFPAVF